MRNILLILCAVLVTLGEGCPRLPPPPPPPPPPQRKEENKDNGKENFIVDNNGSVENQSNIDKNYGPITYHPINFYFYLTVNNNYNYNPNGINRNFIPIDTIINGFAYELQKIVYKKKHITPIDLIAKDTTAIDDEKIILYANKTKSGDIMLTAFTLDSIKGTTPSQIEQVYAPIIETELYKYVGNLTDSTHLPHGHGTMTIKTDNYILNDNSPITANKGDIIIGEYNEGNLIKYTQLDKNGDTLRFNHTPSEYDFVFPIDSTDLKNYPLKQRKHIDVGLGNLFAVSNKYYKQKKIIPQDVNIGADMTKEARDEFLAMFNSKSKFEYNPKKVGESAYRIQKDINGFFITAIVKTKQGLDTIKRRRNELKIRFNEKWQISGFDCKLLPDNIQFCDNVDKETQKYITHWLWEFRVAYGKNVDSVLLFFDNNAKILTGNIHEDRTDSTLHNRDSYGDKLRVIYQNEKRPPKLTFTDAYVCRCSDKNWLNWYDIRLYQDWHNRLYNDDGCLSMRWKIDNLADKPIIFVRCWKEDEDVDLSAYWPVKF